MWEAIASNRRRSNWLIGIMGALLVVLGFAIGMAFEPQYGGAIGALAALVLWLILTLVAMFQGDSVLLASMRAHEIKKEDAPQLWNVVEEMTIAAGLPRMPKVYVIEHDAPNAFAVGRNPKTAAVAVTSGLLRRLNRDELQGVVAHELGHVRNLDVRFMTLASVMMASIALLADVFLRSLWYGGGGRRSSSRGGGQAQAIILVVAIVIAILAPITAQLLYFACSRRREYLADASGALFTRYPEGLASALEKIAKRASLMEKPNRAVVPMFIVNPLQSMSASGLTATHPPTDKRIAVLRSMAGGAGYAEYEAAYRKVHGQKSRCLGERTLSEGTSAAIREPSAEVEKQSAVERSREVVNLLDRIGDYLLMTCVCGLGIKIPPGFKHDKVRCPRCGRANNVPKAKARPAAAGGASAGVAGARPAGAGTASVGAPETQPEIVYHRKGTGWESVQCPCGAAVQLSPNFSASYVSCRECGRHIRVEKRNT